MSTMPVYRTGRMLPEGTNFTTVICHFREIIIRIYYFFYSASIVIFELLPFIGFISESGITT